MRVARQECPAYVSQVRVWGISAVTSPFPSGGGGIVPRGNYQSLVPGYWLMKGDSGSLR